MGTSAPSEVRYYADLATNLPDYPSSVFSGIVSSKVQNTYHRGISDLPKPGGYSNRYPDDKMPTAGNTGVAVAIDQSMAKQDMIKEWNRYHRVWLDRSWDTRAQYIAEYIGWNGVGEPEGLDFQAGTRTVRDRSHWTHSHKARRRRYWNSRTATLAMISTERGESHDQWLASQGATPSKPAPITPRKEDRMYLMEARSNDKDGKPQRVLVLITSNGEAIGPMLYDDLAGKQATMDAWSRMAGAPADNVPGAVWNDTMEALDIDGWRYDLETFVLQVPAE